MFDIKEYLKQTKTVLLTQDAFDELMQRAFAQQERCEDCENFNKTRLLIPQPERKTGRWEYGEDKYGIDGYHCTKCGFFVPWDYTHKFINFIEDFKFCPNCGARMEGGADGI